MEHFNDSLFLLINAPAHPSAGMLSLAHVCASYLILLYPLILAVGWLRGSEETRRPLLEAGLAGVIGLLISMLIGLVWQHPRPFVVGIGHTFLHHAPDSSFPSDHLTFIWSVSFALMASLRLRGLGIFLAILGLSVAWARIYLGVHFPLDMIGAAIVALVSAWLCRLGRRSFVEAIYSLASAIYRAVFAPAIRRGWVKP
jgi:undecaprenyl-diphosphatase